MTNKKSMCCGIEFESQSFSNLPGRIKSSESFGYIVRSAFTVHVADPNEDVRVRVVTVMPELDNGDTDNLDWLGQGRTRECEYVRAVGEFVVVSNAVHSFAEQWASDCRRRIAGIVGERNR